VVASGAVPFVGREVELQALRDSLRHLAQGAPSMVLIEGEAGIGKTRLLEEALALALKLGVHVLSARGHELERTRPFGIVADALDLRLGSPDPERAAIARLLWGDASGSTSGSAANPGSVHRIVEDIVALLDRLASAGPVVLALEDLQWADASTLVVLHATARRLKVPLAALCTFRPSPSSPEMVRLVEGATAAGATHLALRPLPDDDVATLAAAVTGTPPGPRVRSQLGRGHGNPFFVIELVRVLAAESDFDLGADPTERSDPALPPSLRRILLRRIGYLPGPSLEVLRMGAVLGESFEVSQLALVTGRSVLELTGVLEEALRSGVLAAMGNRLAFRHDLVREALYADLAEPVRAGLHLEVGRALARVGAPPLQVAEHLALGATPGDNDAVSWLRDAAMEARTRAPAVAAELLERAVGLAAPGHPDRDALAADLVVACLWAGRPGAAESTARELLDRAHDPSVETQVRLFLIEALVVQDKTTEAYLEGQVALAAPDTPGWARARLVAEASFGPILFGDLEAGAATARAALQEAGRVQDELAACIALSALSFVSALEGHLDAGIAYATLALEQATSASSPEAAAWKTRGYGGRSLGWLLANSERSGEAEIVLRDGRRLCEDFGTVALLATYHWILALTLFMSGEWDDAIAEAEAGFGLAQETGGRAGIGAIYAMVAMIDLQRGDLRSANESLRTAQGYPPPALLNEWPLWARALVDEASGQLEGAVAVFCDAWEAAARRGAALELVRLGPDYVRMLVASGRSDRARGVAAQVEGVAGRPATRWSQASALRCRGLVENDPALLLEAVALVRSAPRPVERAQACEEAAAVLIGCDRATEATGLLEEALAAYQRLDAARGVARVEADLRSLGRRPAKRGWRQRAARVGWESLTRTELAVVDLVGQGLTNREAARQLYISPRTVETHLSHVFAKLEVSSRTEIRSEIARHKSHAR
jgi:DNA-binding CsgD family transcriptional regulator